MNYIWFILILLAIIVGMYSGQMDKVSESVISGIKNTIDLAIFIVGIMTFWMGIMKIAEKSGLIDIIAKILTPVGRVLFPEIPNTKDGSEVIGDVAFNFTANAFGLGNAATPMGIKAIKKMQEFNKDKESASNPMCMLLAMNTAGFQLIPVTVIAVLAKEGAENPSEVILPTLLVTTIAFISAILIAKAFEKIWKSQTKQQNSEEEQND